MTICLVALFTGVNDAAAQAGGRVSGSVKDGDGQPIEGAQVTATSPAMDGFVVDQTTNKKGKFVIAFANAAMSYVIEVKKEGYKTLVTPVNPVPGRTTMVDYVLMPSSSDDLAVAEKAALSGAGRAILVYNEGVEAQRMGDFETAAKKYKEAADDQSGVGGGPHLAGRGGQPAGRFREAAAEAEMALAIDPTDVRALQLRFDSYRQAGNTEKADEAAKALQEVGGAKDAATQVFNEGAEAYNDGDVATAISKFQQAAALDPTLVQAQLVLAKLFFSEGSLSEALARAEQVLALEPDNGDALRITYDSALRLGQPEVAAEALDGLVASDPEWATTGLFQHAVELYNAGQTEEAIQALEKVLEVDPDHARSHYLLGMALFNTGQSEPAAEHLNRFIELAPDDPDTAIAKDLLAYAKQ